MRIKKSYIFISILIIITVVVGCNYQKMMPEKYKKQKIAEYLISPEKNPLEVFDYIKDAYGDKKFFDVVNEWGLMEYYDVVYGD